ncbi:MAG: hypothetical protein NVS2B12_23410 [Ktedonobacteraceae bacterium]
MKAIRAVYNFIVGDMIILIGVLLVIAILAIVNNVAALAPIRGLSGAFLIVAILVILTTTLYREAGGMRR